MIHIIYIFLYVEIKDSIKEFTITLIHIIYLSPYVDPCVKLNKNKNWKAYVITYVMGEPFKLW